DSVESAMTVKFHLQKCLAAKSAGIFRADAHSGTNAQTVIQIWAVHGRGGGEAILVATTFFHMVGYSAHKGVYQEFRIALLVIFRPNIYIPISKILCSKNCFPFYLH